MVKDLVSIVIVTWNSMETIQLCLDSVYQQAGVDHEIIIVDNGSTDGLKEYIKAHYPDVKTIFNDKNAGYAKGNNQGINAANGEYILLLNADAVIDENCLRHLLKSLKENPDTGSASGKVLKLNGASRIFDSTGIQLNRRTFSPTDRGEGQADVGQYDKMEYIFGASGAAACFSREMLEQLRVNGEIFDEDFFAYYEDVDLAWRAQLYGWKCLYVPEAVVHHIRKGPKLQNRKIYAHSFKNRYLCYIKNETAQNFMDFVPFNLVYEMLRCVKRFFLEPYLLSSVYLFLTSLPIMWKKRKIIQKNRRVSPEYLKQFN